MIEYSIDDDGIATLAWDIPGRSMNVLNRASLAAYREAVDRALKDDTVRGVIVTSGKADFIAGADLEELLVLDGAAEITDVCTDMKALLRDIETGGKPFVAAINGTALGGGYELCLACHRRIAANAPRALIGLPEVTIGLLPGGGGTQRLPRMIGIAAALPLLLEGMRFDPQGALEAGLVDEVVEAEALLQAAKAWIMAGGSAEKPWYDRKYHPPGPAVQSPGGYALFIPGNAMLHAKTRGNYPAPQAIMSCVYEGMQVPIDVGMRIETRYFTKLLMGAEARNLIRTMFFSIGDARKLRARPKDTPEASYTKIGVLGAGMMGAGIAYVSAKAGLDVVLLDTGLESAERGKAYSERVLRREFDRGRLDEAGMAAILDRIRPTTDYGDLAGAELVIEAVFEDRAIKAEVTRKAEAVLTVDAVYASNTSTLPITGLAEASERPANVIGLHFFSPVDRMQLVEVIRGRGTSDETLAKALDFVKRIRKVPILVNDSRGFYTSRVFANYLDEGMGMLAEGVAPALIENAGWMAGYPVGPLALTDEVSLELVHRVRNQHRQDDGEAYVEHLGDPILARMVETLGRTGRKNGGGFYDYPVDGAKRLWPDLAKHYPARPDQPDVEEVKRRLLFSQSVEAARCLEEGVLTDPRDGDIGSVLGWSFPSYTGGALSFIDMIGSTRFVAECDRMANTYGERFAPPGLLRDMAKTGAAFY